MRNNVGLSAGLRCNWMQCIDSNIDRNWIAYLELIWNCQLPSAPNNNNNKTYATVENTIIHTINLHGDWAFVHATNLFEYAYEWAYQQQVHAILGSPNTELSVIRLNTKRKKERGEENNLVGCFWLDNNAPLFVSIGTRKSRIKKKREKQPEGLLRCWLPNAERPKRRVE